MSEKNFGLEGLSDEGFNESTDSIDNVDGVFDNEIANLEENESRDEQYVKTGSNVLEEKSDLDSRVSAGDPKKDSGGKKFPIGKVVAGVLVGAGLASLGGSVVNAEKNKEKSLLKDNDSISLPLGGGEDPVSISMSEEGLTFLDSSVGSGLDWEGLVKEDSLVEAIEQESVFSEGESEEQEPVEFLEFGSREEFERVIPSVEKLKEYEFVRDRSHKRDGTPIRVNSDMFYAISLGRDISSGSQPKVFSLETEVLKDIMNNQRRLDWSFRYDELEGFAFKVDSLVTLVGPEGDLVEFGKVRVTEQDYLFVLTKYVDLDSKEYNMASLDWEGYRIQNFGQEKNMTSFENFTTNFYKELNNDENSSFISKDICDGEIGGKLHSLLYETPKLRELEVIGEYNRDVKVVLGLSNAINEYMQEMRESGNYDPESFVEYVLNYVDPNGESWYEEFFEMYMDWLHYTTDYENELELKKDLEVVLGRDSKGSILIDKYELFNVYSKLVGLKAPSLESKTEEEIRNRILERDFDQGPIEIPGDQEVIGCLYDGANFSMEKVVPGDILFPDWLVFKVYHSREKDGSFNLWVLGIERGELGDSVRLDSINSRKGAYLVDTLQDGYLLRDYHWDSILD